MKLKNLIKVLAFLLVGIFLFVGIYKVLSWKDTSGAQSSVFSSIYATDDNLVDVLFLGSSHCYCTINNAILWDDYGLSTFDMAVSGQDMVSTYYCFKEALKTQKPKVVCVEMTYAGWYGYDVEGNLFRNILNYSYSRNYYDAVTSLMDEDRQMDVLLKIPIIHTRYKELTEYDFTAQKVFNRGFSGSYSIGSSYRSDYDPKDDIVALKQDTEEWIYKIINLARENNIEICFFLSPFPPNEMVSGNYRALAQLADQENIPFINFLEKYDELNIDCNTDYRDVTHMNNSGAEKITDYIGKYLVNNYSLIDHRGNDTYELWEENSTDWKHQETQQSLITAPDFATYINYLKNLDNYTVVLSLDGTYSSASAAIQQVVEILGINKETFDQGGTFVLENNLFKYFSEGKSEYLYHQEIGNSDLKVQGMIMDTDENGTETLGNEIVIDNTDYKKVLNGINIVVYDNFSDSVVDAVGYNTDDSLNPVR